MYTLTEAQVTSFRENGWLGPLPAFTPAEVEPVRKYLDSVQSVSFRDGVEQVDHYNEFLGFATPREHHLTCAALRDLLRDERIVGRLNQLGEPDLLLWRTGLFCHPPGHRGLDWHQAYDYFGWDVADDVPPESKTLMFPPGEDTLDLNIWLALDDVTVADGCLAFASGTHRTRFRQIKVDAAESAFAAQLAGTTSVAERRHAYAKTFDFAEDEWETQDVEVAAGEIVIFTERTMHRSSTNLSDKPRVALNARYLRPSVRIYPHRELGVLTDGAGVDIAKHYSILVSGTDRYGYNVVDEA